MDSTTVMHILPSIYGILCIVGVAANSLVIYAVATCKKRMVSDIYVLNLAIADMLFLLVMPFTIHQLVRDRHWVFGNFMCKAVTVVDVSNQFTTVGIVTVLCIDRYVAIVHPASERRTIQWTMVINAMVWTGSFLLTVPVMLYSRTLQQEDVEVCILDLPSGPADMYWYTLYQSTVGFIIPLLIISTFYSLTLYHVFRSIRRVRRRQSVWAKRATKTVLMVIAVFLLCWSPFHVMQVLNLSTEAPTPTFLYAYHISICLSYAHSCINPLMLLFFAQNFQERLCPHKQSHSSQQSTSKQTVVKADGSSTITVDTNYRCTVI
ncbi:melanin-concentrating hormone receptor 2 [Polypterus senegalus]|uniref:melanin-concentrating hormone receptor 2 n=1 Tax=Polypterus senegalus TaxID=55291 RepID=UPI0019638D30|nr:melanin-concentrating hormone receptor 2 [Polypterus senegalus]